MKPMATTTSYRPGVAAIKKEYVITEEQRAKMAAAAAAEASAKASASASAAAAAAAVPSAASTKGAEKEGPGSGSGSGSGSASEAEPSVAAAVASAEGAAKVSKRQTHKGQNKKRRLNDLGLVSWVSTRKYLRTPLFFLRSNSLREFRFHIPGRETRSLRCACVLPRPAGSRIALGAQSATDCTTLQREWSLLCLVTTTRIGWCAKSPTASLSLSHTHTHTHALGLQVYGEQRRRPGSAVPRFRRARVLRDGF